ncbi:hypothetical protein JXB02_02670 [Candidatus Woesearchaeota archaeon]|nr:hypothetical protein [Candidatus Woesearchaeota archaeon]
MGIYDVVLPFLLVFTVVFAILEKTKVFGTEDVEGVKVTKKNLNSMVAFVIAFLVVASTRLVAIINQSLANMVLLLLLIISFLLLIGTFYKEDELPVFLEGGWRTGFTIAVLVIIVLIWLYAIGWLMPILTYISGHWDNNWVASIILLLVIVLFMLYITKDQKPSRKKSSD